MGFGIGIVCECMCHFLVYIYCEVLKKCFIQKVSCTYQQKWLLCVRARGLCSAEKLQKLHDMSVAFYILVQTFHLLLENNATFPKHDCINLAACTNLGTFLSCTSIT